MAEKNRKISNRIQIDLESLVKKGYATKIMVNGHPEYGLTEEGLKLARELKCQKKTLK